MVRTPPGGAKERRKAEAGRERPSEAEEEARGESKQENGGKARERVRRNRGGTGKSV